MTDIIDILHISIQDTVPPRQLSAVPLGLFHMGVPAIYSSVLPTSHGTKRE